MSGRAKSNRGRSKTPETNKKNGSEIVEEGRLKDRLSSRPKNLLRDKGPRANTALCDVQEWLQKLETIPNQPSQQLPVQMSITPKVANLAQIQQAVHTIRLDTAYGPNINITQTPNYEKFARSFKCTNVRFIENTVVELGTTVNCFIGAHSAVKGILTAVDPPKEDVPYSVLHVDIPDLPLPLPTSLPKVSYVLGNLLRQSLLGEPLLMALKNIIESNDNLSIEQICRQLNEACKDLRTIKLNEVKLYLEFCDSQLEKRIEIYGEEACSGELAIPLDFKPVLRKFADIFLVQANYVPCDGIPLKSIVFSKGSSDVYNISWKFVDHSIRFWVINLKNSD